ncbi:hypothetical protein [Bartonella ancashensis]|uniref:Uncharacterized protein n=1 Tax=Bartonella ancashensis TaxID=1318743 RepID=A0A0M3T371_9HYPH|nr:hypothetical protein [Bartonella ancashensis]ALE04091.1 hypothetical protein PU02_1277 [Bartonella ancashensis]
MVDARDKHQYSYKSLLIYAVGFCSILAVIIFCCFHMAKPYLDNFVKKEISRRAIEVEKSEISIMGKVNLTQVTVPTPNNMSLKIGAVSGRPPIFFIPGSFVLYDVEFKYDDLHLQIPKIFISGISLKKKDPTIASLLLQSLMRIGVASVYAENISLSTQNTPIEKFTIENLQLSDLKNGYIRSINIDNITSNVNLASTTSSHLHKTNVVAKSDVAKAYNVDVAYVYSVIFDAEKVNNQNKTVIGQVLFKNTMIDLFKEGEKSSSFSLGEFKMFEFNMRPFEQAPKKLLHAYFEAKKTNNKKDQKIAQSAILMTAISAITSIDAEMKKINLNTPQFEAAFNLLKLKSNGWKQPIPENFLLSVTDFSIFPQKHLNFLKILGLQNLDFSGAVDVSYDEKKNRFFLNTLSLYVNKIASGTISAKIVDMDKKFFSGKKDAIIASFQEIGVAKINMNYKDLGLIDRIFSYLARDIQDGEQSLKKELYDDLLLIMTQSPRILLKNRPEAENISKALHDFVKNPQSLTIEITAKDKNGLKASDLNDILKNNLSSLLDKVNLTIKNEPFN